MLNAGFKLHAKDSNPFVRDRVVSLQTAICNGEGYRHLKVNTRLCPVLTECLEQQIFDKNGDPDKQGGKDHMPDALGYLIYWRYPVVKPVMSKVINVPHMGR